MKWNGVRPRRWSSPSPRSYGEKGRGEGWLRKCSGGWTRGEAPHPDRIFDAIRPLPARGERRRRCRGEWQRGVISRAVEDFRQPVLMLVLVLEALAHPCKGFG